VEDEQSRPGAASSARRLRSSTMSSLKPSSTQGSPAA
jgi:hypothetical protein